MERKLSILKSKVDEIITICQNAAGKSKTRPNGEAETMADHLHGQTVLYDWFTVKEDWK